MFPFVFLEGSVTSHNLSTILNIMDDSLWEVFSHYINTPKSERIRMGSKYSNDKERKQAVSDYFISSHPAPSWRLVARALYQMGWVVGRESSHRALTHLQQLFPTGTMLTMVLTSFITNLLHSLDM